jgi:hypothetical protein
MDPDIDLGSGLTTAAAEITSQVGAALPVALGVGAAILAVTVGWKIFRRFVRG